MKLKWSYIDWENKFIRLPGERLKEGKPKDIPFNKYVEKIFKVAPQGGDFIITYQGKNLNQCDSIKKSLKTACTKSAHFFFHSSKSYQQLRKR